MKYYKRLKVYKASNVVYSPEECSAYSYDWWKFLTKDKNGIVIFNDYTYSNSTAKHQSKVMGVLKDNIDIMLRYTHKNLTDINECIEDEKKQVIFKIDWLFKEIGKPRSWKSTNERRKKEIKGLTSYLDTLNQYLATIEE